MLIGSMIGLSGSLVSLRNQKIGGLFLIAGAVASAPLAIWIRAGFWYSLVLFIPSGITPNLIIFSLLYGAIVLPSFLLFVGGPLTIPKIRHIAKSLFHRLSEWYYGIPERLAAA